MKQIYIIAFTLLSFSAAFAQSSGDVFFGVDTVHEIHLDFTEPFFWDSLVFWKEHADLTGENIYRPGVATVDGVLYGSIGVRIKGNSSYSGYPGNKKPFKLKFTEYNSALKIDGLKKLSLNNSFNDPTMLREKLLLDYERKHNIAAPRCTYAKVYLNGTYWGLYTVVEQIDKTFLGDYFPENNGNLYKGDPMGKLRWEGPNPSAYYDNHELKTNETLNDWSDLVRFIDIINNTTAPDFQDSLNQVFNTSGFLRNNAVNMLFVSLDSYVGIGHNYYIYHNLQSDKFEWITWDANSCFGVFNNQMTIPQLKELSVLYIKPPSSDLPLLQNIYANASLKAAFLNYISGFLSTDFTTAYFYPKIDSLADLIRTDLYADTKKMFSNAEFEDNLEYTIVTNGFKQIPPLKDFLADRIDAVILELAGLGIVVGVEDSRKQNMSIFPNPASKFFRIKNGETIREVTIIDILGKVVYQSKPGSQLVQVDITGLPRSGIYLISIKTDLSTKFEKLLVY